MRIKNSNRHLLFFSAFTFPVYQFKTVPFFLIVDHNINKILFITPFINLGFFYYLPLNPTLVNKVVFLALFVYSSVESTFSI